jgi:TPR repeat protein
MNVKQDFAKAEKWFLKGAKMVHHNAMYDLAASDKALALLI